MKPESITAIGDPPILIRLWRSASAGGFQITGSFSLKKEKGVGIGKPALQDRFTGPLYQDLFGRTNLYVLLNRARKFSSWLSLGLGPLSRFGFRTRALFGVSFRFKFSVLEL